MRWVTVLLTPSAAAISFTARCRLWPMDGGASNSTTPSRVVRNARVVVAVGDPVQVPLDASDVVALVIDGGAERGPRNRHVIRQDGRARGRRCHGCPPVRPAS